MELAYEGLEPGGKSLPEGWCSAGLEVELDQVAVLAHEADNVAIAKVDLPRGARIRLRERRLKVIELNGRVLEGHRFCVQEIAVGKPLLSWAVPFGTARCTIYPGEYVCNEKVRAALVERGLSPAKSFQLNVNFDDIQYKPYAPPAHFSMPCAPSNVDEAKLAENVTFQGFKRRGNRGYGTRNVIAVIGTCNLVSNLVLQACAKLENERVKQGWAFDSIAPVVHTESGTGNNAALFRRTLAGFIVHPNIAGALVVSRSFDAFTSLDLESYMRSSKGEEDGASDFCGLLDSTPHYFLTMGSGLSFEEQLDCVVRTMHSHILPAASAPENCTRTPAPLSELRVALQCGGSDAFSGVSANPLVGSVAGQVVERGGAALLAETDELIGAESYILTGASLATQEKFLEMIARIKQLLGWHGVSAEGNPSGGNLYRGLYNISIKSLGAATKKPAHIRLDDVYDYAFKPKAMHGYLFMHSPGNDLESVAGQVACGCNLIFFTTGNGAVTNFPFVPTLKVVTTSERFRLLADDMDFNAGALLDDPGSFDKLRDRLFAQMLQSASGQRTVGEQSMHLPQVSIWRDWAQVGPESLEAFAASKNARPSACVSEPSSILPSAGESAEALLLQRLIKRAGDLSAVRCRPHVLLVLPSSLCSSEVARTLALKLSAKQDRPHLGKIDIVAALPHTEGCGSNYGDNNTEANLKDFHNDGQGMFDRILLGHLGHPHVAQGLLIEHGCEMNHNDRMWAKLVQHGLVVQGESKFFRASVQRDGGVRSVLEKCIRIVSEHIRKDSLQGLQRRSGLRVGFLCACRKSCCARKRHAFQLASLALCAQAVMATGGLVVDILLPRDKDSDLLLFPECCTPFPFAQSVVGSSEVYSCMQCPSNDWLECLSGLAATGVDVVVGWGCDHAPLVGHPFVPVIQAGTCPPNSDVLLTRHDQEEEQGSLEKSSFQLLSFIQQVIERQVQTKSQRSNNVGFQIPRGPLGVSV